MNAKSQHATLSFRKVFLAQHIVWTLFQTWIVYPGNFFAFLQPFGKSECISGVFCHSDFKSFEALKNLKSTKGAQRSSKIAQSFHTNFCDKSRSEEHTSELQSRPH